MLVLTLKKKRRIFVDGPCWLELPPDRESTRVGITAVRSTNIVRQEIMTADAYEEAVKLAGFVSPMTPEGKPPCR